MQTSLSKEEQVLLSMLRHALTKQLHNSVDGSSQADSCVWKNEDYDGEAVIALAKAHKVVSFMYDEMMEMPVSDVCKQEIASIAKTVVAQNLRLLFLDKYIVNTLEKEGIKVALLKGMATATYYEQPLYRKSGDVDLLLLDLNQLEKAKQVLVAAGFQIAENQPSLHHVVFDSAEGIEIELHTEIAEPFDNKDMNQFMEKATLQCIDNVVYRELCEVKLPTLGSAYHAYELLLHMLQHFLRAGFGLKLLCDWVVFWNQKVSEPEKQLYLELVEACGVKRFSDQITRLCVDYLGLGAEQVAFMDIDVENAEAFLRETLEAEEFGKSAKDRMVALRSGKLKDYVREFHHQMRLNYPKAGKCFLLWPFLWVATLVRFLYNNKKLKRPSTKAILKKAGERGRVIENLQLFQIKK